MADVAEGRLLDIDRAKGFGIALVVWGHMFKHETFNQPLWMEVSRTVIYEFHMPFFMYLSGFVFFFTGAQERFFKRPANYIGKRFDRLMVPFLIFGLIVVLGKFAVASFSPVDDGVDSIGNGLMKVITNAPDNPSVSIWYLLVLFVYSVITPLLWRLGGRHIALLVLIGFVAWLLPLPDAYYLKRIGIYFLFFAVGGVFAIHRDRVLPVLARLWIPALLMLAVACYIFYRTYWALLVCGLLSIPALHGLFLQRFWAKDRILLLLGSYSMAIYLMNTIFIGVAKIAYPRLLPYDGIWFMLFAIAVFAIGIIGPMVVRMVIAAIHPLRPVARYLE